MSSSRCLLVITQAFLYLDPFFFFWGWYCFFFPSPCHMSACLSPLMNTRKKGNILSENVHFTVQQRRKHSLKMFSLWSSFFFKRKEDHYIWQSILLLSQTLISHGGGDPPFFGIIHFSARLLISSEWTFLLGNLLLYSWRLDCFHSRSTAAVPRRVSGSVFVSLKSSFF